MTPTEVPFCPSPTTFGKTAPGGSTGNYSSGNVLATVFAMTGPARVVKLHCYLPNSPTGLIKMALYNDAGGVPGTLLSQSSNQVPVSGWNTVDIPDTASLPTADYWIAFIASAPSGIDMSLDFTPVGGGQFQFWSFGPFPTTFSAGGGNQDWNFAFYADKCP
jgi:hypothetical protein